MGIKAEAGVVPIAGIDLAGSIAALGGTEELVVGRGGWSHHPIGTRSEGMMRVDNSGERLLLRADVGVGDSDQLVAGDALAGRGHARQPTGAPKSPLVGPSFRPFFGRT